jgi:hypothetical protein
VKLENINRVLGLVGLKLWVTVSLRSAGGQGQYLHNFRLHLRGKNNPPQEE